MPSPTCTTDSADGDLASTDPLEGEQTAHVIPKLIVRQDDLGNC